MVISFWWLTAIAGAALAAGFCMGRLIGEGNEGTDYENRREGRRENRREGQIRFPFLVGSPVSGEVAGASGEGRQAVAVHPSEDKLYAPANGKVIKIYPMGNAFLFRTEFGAELYIKAGDTEDDLMERYYRPRVIQNEIVGKGKLLLEFDRGGLVKEGASCCVSMRVETGVCEGNIIAVPGAQVKAGEPLLGLRIGIGEECPG